MPLMKVTFIFECRNKGWSESYYRSTVFSDPALMTPAADALAQKRLLIAGKEVTMTYIRIQTVDVLRRVKLLYLGDTRKGVATRAADNPESALILKLTDGTGGRSKTTFIRGYWDISVDAGGNYDPLNVFVDALDDFITELKNGAWGWLGVSVQTSQLLATLVQDASGTISGTLAAPLFAVGQVGKTLPVRFRGITQPGNLNGQNPVVALTVNSFRTKKRIAMLPWAGDGNIQLSEKLLVLINSGEITGVSERKTGRVFGSPRGRQPARKRA